MKENVERSDPVAGYRDVTTEQLDALHASCSDWGDCQGPFVHRARERAARVQQSMTDMTQSMARITNAISEVNQVLRSETPWGHVEVVQNEETLADWERELLAGAYRETLQAGLQHQRIGNA